MNDFERDQLGLTADEAAFIERFTASRCRPHGVVMAERLRAFVARRMEELVEADADGFELAAATADSPARPEKIESPDEEVVFTFASDAPNDWRARLAIPPRATAETVLTVCVTGADGAPVDEGTLRLAGCLLPLTDGAAQMPFGLFLGGIQDVDVSLRRPDGAPVPGRLTFFGGE